MKKCPNCSQIFEDDNDFCTNDGTTLVPDTGPQGFGGFKSSGEMPTQYVPHPQSAVAPPAARSSNLLYLVVGILATALAATGLYLFSLRDSAQQFVAANGNVSQATNAPSSTSAAKTPSNTMSNAVNAIRAPNPQSTPEPITTIQSRPSGGTWFIVLGSYPKVESEKANQRLRYVQGLGYQANIVDTDDYPGFRSGLWSIVVGPYSKSDAKGMAAKMKSSISDAYIKSAW
jgi:cell division septation protein DedD